MELEGPEKVMKVQPIRNGTVIDHIAAGKALYVLEVLGLAHGKTTGATISFLSRVPSKRGNRKDIIKVEDRELTPSEVQMVALISPGASINIIRNFAVAKKFNVDLPETIEGLVRCPNPNCISNQREPVPSQFHVDSESPLALTCYYCERTITDVEAQLI